MSCLKLYLLGPFLFFFSFNITAQFGVLVGYDLNYFPYDAHNKIIQAHNANLNYEDSFSDIHFMSGLQIGLQYRTDNAGIYLKAKGKFKNTKAEGTDDTTNNLFENKLVYRYISSSLGVTSYFGNFGLGASVDYNFNSIRADFSSPLIDKKNRFGGFSNTIYLEIEFQGGNNISLSLQPFVQLYWKDADISGLAENISVEQVHVSALSNNNFGISFIFNNNKY